MGTFLILSRFNYLSSLPRLTYLHSIMEILLIILTILVIFSCLSAWFNAAELDTDDENF